MGTVRRAALAAVGVAVASVGAPALEGEQVDIISAILNAPQTVLRAAGLIDDPYYTDLNRKHLQKMLVEKAAPAPGLRLAALDPVPLRLTAKGPNARMVHRTVEASEGDFTAEMDVGWPAAPGPYGDAFLQVNFFDAEGNQVAELGLIGSFSTASEAGVSVAACYTYGGPAQSGFVGVPVTLGPDGSRLRLRATLVESTFTFSAADAATGSFVPVIEFPDIAAAGIPPAHTIEFGHTVFAKGGVVLTTGATAAGALHGTSDVFLDSLAGAFAEANNAHVSLLGDDTEAATVQLDSAANYLAGLIENLGGLDAADVQGTGLSLGVFKAAGKSGAAAKKLLEKASDAAALGTVDLNSTLKGIQKICEGGAILKKLPKSTCRSALKPQP